MGQLFADGDRFSAGEIPRVTKFQRIVNYLNRHILHRKTKFESPGNYEHWTECVKYDDGGDGMSVYDKLKQQLNPNFDDKKCATVCLSRSPDNGASSMLYKTSYNFVCDGVGDEKELQNAWALIAQRGLGKIFFRKGIYEFEESSYLQFPMPEQENKAFCVVIEGEQGAQLHHKIPFTAEENAMFILQAENGYVYQPTLIFRNLVFLGGSSTSRFIKLNENATMPYTIIFDRCAFWIRDELIEQDWSSLNLFGSNKVGHIYFNECYFRRKYLYRSYPSGFVGHLGHIIKADNLASINIENCIFEDRGNRHDFDKFIYVPPVR